jgi:DNA-binding NarL/FixJ family response regulator
VQVVLKLMQGKSNKLIATELGLGESTVKTHLTAAMRSLGVTNRTEAVFKAASLGLLPPPVNTQFQSE